MSKAQAKRTAKQPDRDATLSIQFRATLRVVGRRIILRLPKPASKQLPSRGQVAVRGTLNGRPFETVIEPDGEFGHWMNVDAKLRAAAAASPGDEVAVGLEPTKEWPEPKVPKDLKAAVSSAPPAVQDLWRAITPMARWEWVRWVTETKNPSTRERRVEVTISKMSGGKRRPCCFNLASCTDPELAKSGKLALE